MLLGDFISLGLNLGLFRFLFEQLGRNDFAAWEWLTLLLGLCLLVPRNGLDIIAIRSSVRHPGHLRIWVASVLLVRVALSIVAMLLFTGLAGIRLSMNDPVLLPLAATLLVSSFSPDLGARVQGRFRKAGFILILRNAMFLAALVISGSFMQLSLFHAGCWLLLAEMIVCICWWHDCFSYNILPSSKAIRLLRLGWRPILLNSLEQTGVRFVRVLSWSIDALVLGALVPEFWAEVAPSRRFLMTAVVPFAGWLGVFGPLMADRSRIEIQQWARHLLGLLFCLTLLSSTAAIMIGPQCYDWLIGRLSHETGMLLALNAIRLLPMVGFQILSSEYTAMRQDSRALQLIGLHLAAQLAGLLVGTMMKTASYAVLALVFLETVAFGFVLSIRSFHGQSVIQPAPILWWSKIAHMTKMIYQPIAFRIQRETCQLINTKAAHDES